MTNTSALTIYPCEEYGEVDIPINELLGENGKLNIYPEVTGRGYFDVDFRAGRLTLKATRYLGLIPISPKISIHVQSRIPLRHLVRMIERSGVPMRSLSGFVRGYETQYGALENPQDVYLDAFISALDQIRREGIYKSYVSSTTDQELRGRLLLSNTIDRYRSRGITNRAYFEIHDLTHDNPPNRIIKYVGERLLSGLRISPTRDARKKASRLSQLLAPFSLVNDSAVDPHFIARNASVSVRSLPKRYEFYEPVLWLAYLIATRSGFVMEKIGQAKFETVVLDAAEIFEKYVRRLLNDGVKAFSGCTVLDGNVKPVSLFAGQRASTKPDYYFARDQVAVAVADAKYKPSISAADRYELLGFCDALNVRNAAFVLPKGKQIDWSAHEGTTATGKSIRIVDIDLAAKDIELEEMRFIDSLGRAIGLIKDDGQG